MESGSRGVSEVDAAIYLTFCGVRKEELEELLNLARAGDDDTWLQEHGDGEHSLHTLIFHETTAATLASYEPMYVPGLLQTPAYARALFEFTQVIRPDRVALAVQARMDRQAVLRKLNPPMCEFFVHENALRQVLGSDRTMNEQLLHLVFVASRPQCQVRVVPRDSGPHGVWGNFMLMGYEHHRPVTFVETLTTSLFLEKPADVAAYRTALGRLEAAALDNERSRAWLASMASEFERRGQD